MTKLAAFLCLAAILVCVVIVAGYLFAAMLASIHPLLLWIVGGILLLVILGGGDGDDFSHWH